MTLVAGLAHEAAQLRSLRPTPIVLVVDDDVSIRESLEPLILRMGLEVATFGTAEDFLAFPRPARPSCLLLDMRLPELNGLELQRRCAAQRQQMPIIFITGYGDVQMTVSAMKAGAIEVLTKPIREELLVAAIREAIDRSDRALKGEAEARALWDLYSLLSRREREVMTLVASGLLNKQVAGELGISEITVKAHRGRLMKKMRARSFADLVVMAGRLVVSTQASAIGSPDETRYALRV